IIETANHFGCIDLIIDKGKSKLTESLIKELHYILKAGTSDSRKDWFNVGTYKKLPNEVRGNETTSPKDVAVKMKELLAEYHAIEKKCFEDIINFHYQFEIIHPFQDGNGRVGRLIMFKECLANNIVPFIIDEDLKLFYYRGLQEWSHIREYLLDTCLTAQDNYTNKGKGKKKQQFESFLPENLELLSKNEVEGIAIKIIGDLDLKSKKQMQILNSIPFNTNTFRRDFGDKFELLGLIEAEKQH